MLIYSDAGRRVAAGGEPPAAVLAEAAAIIQTFVEGYHERLEEELVFPRFERAGLLVDLVATLRAQHEAGRRLTAQTRLRLAPGALADEEDREALCRSLRAFVRMHRPHESREETVLFPAMPRVFTRRELAELGERFMEEEQRSFGASGFEGVVARVAALEDALGTADLSLYTPSGA